MTRLRPAHAAVLLQRFGRFPLAVPAKDSRADRVWIHAASVGEVTAAVMLIRVLAASRSGLSFVVTTMTTSGQSVARSMLPDSVTCVLAPYDLQPAVRRVVHALQPDIYACLETELWPVMLGELQKAGICKVLLNGRLTERSFGRYKRVQGLMRQMVQGFAAIAVIRRQDGERFACLGASRDRIRLTGNIKYDFPGTDIASVRKANRDYLQVEEEDVFICGSTRSGEEALLVGAYRRLCQQSGTGPVWVIAPRHMDRLADVRSLLAAENLPCDLYTELAGGKRKNRVILVDCLGELSELYSAGDYNFVGGSLVRRGGHNLMEAARWGRPVYYGPYTDDFSDAAEILEAAGAGFKVPDSGLLADRILAHMHDRGEYESACRNALKAVEGQHGAADRQASLLSGFLNEKNNSES